LSYSNTYSNKSRTVDDVRGGDDEEASRVSVGEDDEARNAGDNEANEGEDDEI
jgi:hypothetical protein